MTFPLNENVCQAAMTSIPAHPLQITDLPYSGGLSASSADVFAVLQRSENLCIMMLKSQEH
jgi:hypothetical protein